MPSRLDIKLDELLAAIQSLEAEIAALRAQFPAALDAQGRLKTTSL